MKRLKLLQEPEDSSAMLETDIMRFVAIIGMVFWIIFSLVQQTTPPPLPEPEAVRQQTQVKVAAPVVPNMRIPETMEQAEVKSVTESGRQVENDGQQVSSEIERAKAQGILLQFAGLADLEQLINIGSIRLFGWAGGAGFDLYFAGEQENGRMVFHKCGSLPEQLWEITGPREYRAFIEQMSSQNQAIRSLPNKRVLISFEDRNLEAEVEELLARLISEGKDGILSITADSSLHFSPHSLVNKGATL